MAFLALNSAPEHLDIERLLKIAIVHDVAEAEVGDIAKRAVDAEVKVSESENQEMERHVAEKYSRNLDGQLIEVWEEYKSRSTD